MDKFLSGLVILQAQAGGSSMSMVSTIITFGLVFVIFYFLIIRPQNKKQKEAKAMVAAMKKGDKVVSIGGIHGVVTSVKESTVVVKVDDDTKLEFSKSAIQAVTQKSAEFEDKNASGKPEEEKK
ncbi:MAG TPA: preprotein translocase subunit YajC [Rectinemataceae bacterium]|nr:preprotein translocase subunit YajC [Rectinemataceae bacterium]